MNKPSQLVMQKIDDHFLKERLQESRAVIREVARLSENPLVIQFSGGKDSMALVGLVREVTDNFVCFYMVTGIEFREATDFVISTAKDMGLPLLVSTPSAHMGGFFKRMRVLKRFPVITHPWCLRDLKLRPQRKVLEDIYGKGVFYKLNGVRRYESTRRRFIYSDGRTYYPDPEHKGSWQVYPILNWANSDVLNYLRMTGLPDSGLYKRYGVSGCYWCPFYQKSIYERVLRSEPDLYDEFIEWETRLNQPSVNGLIYLKALKEKVISEGLVG